MGGRNANAVLDENGPTKAGPQSSQPVLLQLAAATISAEPAAGVKNYISSVRPGRHFPLQSALRHHHQAVPAPGRCVRPSFVWSADNDATADSCRRPTHGLHRRLSHSGSVVGVSAAELPPQPRSRFRLGAITTSFFHLVQHQHMLHHIATRLPSGASQLLQRHR
jgi:hypothetical protein